MDARDTGLTTDGGDPTSRRETDPADGDGDRTAVVEELYDRIPFHRAHDVEVQVVTPQRAEIELPFDGSLVGNPDLEVLHGGVISALVDLTGAAVFTGGQRSYTPTVDLRVDYLEAAGRRPLSATAAVDRRGEHIGVASVEVKSGETVCATGTGVYKLSDD